MPDIDTLALLDELDAAREKATPGPWWAWDRGVGWHIATEDPDGVDHLPGRPYVLPEGFRTDLARAEDAALIVAAANWLPQLTAALRAVEGVVRRLDACHGMTLDRPGEARAYREAADWLRTALAAALTAEATS